MIVLKHPLRFWNTPPPQIYWVATTLRRVSSKFKWYTRKVTKNI